MSQVSRSRLSPKVEVLEIANASATARISLYGGQVLGFRPRHDGRERLYLSRIARLDGSKSIRGGIPVCWPWFGAHRSNSACPSHGYARNRQWHVVEEQPSTDSTSVILKATDTRDACFGFDTDLYLHVVVGETLQLGLMTRNCSPQPCRITCALHTYFAVQDIRDTEIRGLAGTYSDKVRDFACFETPTPYRFTSETDRIHPDPSGRVTILEKDSSTGIESSGHDSIVVWNPWTACAINFPDMEADDYLHMLCVESAVTQGVEVPPGGTHVLRQVIT